MDTTQSSTWSFTTMDEPNTPPDPPSNPVPGDGATDVDIDPSLSVDVSDPDGDSMTVTFYDASDDSVIGTDTGVPSGGTASVVWSDLEYSTSYSWYTVADDGMDTTQSSTWSFTTGEENLPPDRPGVPSGPQFGYVNFLYEYTVSTTDPDGDDIYYKFDWNDGTTSPWLGPYPSGATGSGLHSWTDDGTYSVRVKAKDTHGQETSWSPILIVTIEEGLTVDINGPYYGFEEVPIEFSSTVTGGEGPYSYNWDFGDGKSSTLANPTHTYTTKGTYNVVLTVTDSIGLSGQDSTLAVIAEYTDFGVNVAGPYSGKVNQMIQFQSFVLGGTEPYTYTWEFGDGGSSSESHPQHAYTSAGTYTVILTVMDDEGRIAQDSTTATITLDDTTPPTIELLKPLSKLYLFNNEIIDLWTTLIIGPIDIEVQVSDDESGVNRVLFYIQGNLKETLYTAPYTYTWDTFALFRNSVKIVAYDNAGNSNEVEFSVWKFF